MSPPSTISTARRTMPIRAMRWKTIVKRFQIELNMTPVGAIELEFFLMDRASALAGKPHAAEVADQRSTARSTTRPIICRTLDDFAPFFKDLYAWCDVQGLPAKTLISEYAPGQMEIVLRHRADVLKACDEAIMLKRADQGGGRKAWPLLPPSWPSPIRSGRAPACTCTCRSATSRATTCLPPITPLQNELLMHAIGGLKAAMAESMLIFAPNANSYRRFRRNSYAPVAANWGINNRTVSLRIPAGAAKACHIEHRPSGADANPYLVMAAILAGMHYGITEKADPGNPVVGNGYERRAKYIPGNWFDAIDAFWRASILKEYFGKQFVDTFCTLKEVEADRFFAEPTLRDFEWYLRAV